MIDAPTILTSLCRVLDDFSIHGVLGYGLTAVAALGRGRFEYLSRVLAFLELAEKVPGEKDWQHRHVV